MRLQVRSPQQNLVRNFTVSSKHLSPHTSRTVIFACTGERKFTTVECRTYIPNHPRKVNHFSHPPPTSNHPQPAPPLTFLPTPIFSATSSSHRVVLFLHLIGSPRSPTCTSPSSVFVSFNCSFISSYLFPPEFSHLTFFPPRFSIIP